MKFKSEGGKHKKYTWKILDTRKDNCGDHSDGGSLLAEGNRAEGAARADGRGL